MIKKNIMPKFLPVVEGPSFMQVIKRTGHQPLPTSLPVDHFTSGSAEDEQRNGTVNGHSSLINILLSPVRVYYN